EDSAARADARAPIAGGCSPFGRGLEGVKTVYMLGFDQALAQLAVRVKQLEGDGVVIRQIGRPVFHDETHKYGIAGPPHATFAIDESLNSFLDHLPAYVKPAERQG